MKLVFFFVIVAVNLLFFAYWVLKMYSEMRVMLLLKYGHLYMALCLCFNRNKLQVKQKAALIAQENEFMREEYSKCNYKNMDLIVYCSAAEPEEIIQQWRDHTRYTRIGEVKYLSEYL